ncbi:MAG: ROK family protein [Pirellulaceae bacterium]
MFLGIEIGGTKLQLGVGAGDGKPLVALERRDIDPQRGAAGILEQIETVGAGLLQKHHVSRIGVGFGGPVDAAAGRVQKSHQVEGWENAPLADWCQSALGRPTLIANDCDAAALAEARFGAGRGKSIVFFVTVGTGVGGGLVIDGRLHGRFRPAAAEIGHLRPGLHADRPDETVESLASGWGIAAAARARLAGDVSRSLQTARRGGGPVNPDVVRQRLADAEQTGREYTADLLHRAGGELDALTAKMVAQAAADGNEVAREVMEHALQALGWAVAQVVTLLAPEVVVVGGGVSLSGQQFFVPLRQQAARYVFPPLTDSYEIAPAALGELVVVHGALALAATCPAEST